MRAHLQVLVFALLLVALAGCATPREPPPQACARQDLALDFRWAGTLPSGALAGGARLANAGPRACYLEDRPATELLDQDGWRLPVQVEDGPPLCASSGTLVAGCEDGVQLLEPGGTTFVWLVWRNYCPAPGDPPQPRVVALTLPGGKGRFAAPTNNGPAAGCEDAALPSTLSVGPFEPDPAQ